MQSIQVVTESATYEFFMCHDGTIELLRILGGEYYPGGVLLRFAVEGESMKVNSMADVIPVIGKRMKLAVEEAFGFGETMLVTSEVTDIVIVD